jgi:hypothetical protein
MSEDRGQKTATVEINRLLFASRTLTSVFCHLSSESEISSFNRQHAILYSGTPPTV